MRRTLAAFLAVAVFLAAGCQDQQARDQNARLQAELEAIKSQKSSSSDDWLKQYLLSNQGKGDADGTDRKLNSLGEDMRAGLDGIKKQIVENDTANNRRIDELETRLRKVSDLEASITALKGMIETLEGKVKGVDPNEVLSVHKDLINKDADLRIEKQARETAEAEAKALKDSVARLQSELDATKAEVDKLMGEDISKHPMYAEQRKKIRALEQDVKDQKDINAHLQRKLDDLEAHLKKGSNPPPDRPDLEPEDHAFTGTVVLVRRGEKADGPSFLMVTVDSGTPPPKDTILVVRDENRARVCEVKVIRHYHVDEKETLPVEEIGCSTIDEKTSNPVTKGDTVVWIKEEPKASGGGD